MIGNPHLNNRQSMIVKLQPLWPVIWAGILLLASSCSGPGIASPPAATLPPTQEVLISPTSAPTLPTPVISTSQPAQATTPAPTVTLSPPPTPDAYQPYTIDALTNRSYGDGEITVVETLDANSYFTRTLISYPSDELSIYGFMNTPQERPGRPGPPYPVVIALHGYIDPAFYNTLDYTTGYADTLARAGFLVLHPNLRGYPPSQDGDNRFRVGMAVDVLNLIGLVRQQAGKPGPLAQADPERIGLWGHSMGGGIAIKVLTVDPDIRAAVLYGAMSADEQLNYERIFNYFSAGTRGEEELQTPDEAFQHISPVNFLGRIRSAVSIHHGENDIDVPLAWSIDLCKRLNALSASVECYTYADQAHTFQGSGSELFMQRVVDFYNRKLR